jgi:YD repeat-containing protein
VQQHGCKNGRVKRRSAYAALFVTLLCTLFLVAPALAGSITYTYDDAGRLVTADYGNGSAIAYTYDNAGNLLARTVGLDNISLTITILSPTERTYPSLCVKLTFIVEPGATVLDWIGYSLDGGARMSP